MNGYPIEKKSVVVLQNRRYLFNDYLTYVYIYICVCVCVCVCMCVCVCVFPLDIDVYICRYICLSIKKNFIWKYMRTNNPTNPFITPNRWSYRYL